LVRNRSPKYTLKNPYSSGSIISDGELREALAKAPPGFFDPGTWAYWHLKLGQYPPPPLPTHVFE